MGFTDFVSDAGLTLLNNWLLHNSYIVGYNLSQADLTVFKQFSAAPDADKYPQVGRWYRHVDANQKFPDFDSSKLTGDATLAATSYGPDETELPINPKAPNVAADEDDDVDLFGSESEEDEEKAAEAARRLDEYNKKKAAGKPKPAAKTQVVLDIKPWDDETDMDELKKRVLAIKKDGLVWNDPATKFVPIGFGIKKLQAVMAIEDEKVSVDDIQAEIEELEDYVQSTDVAQMSKL